MFNTLSKNKNKRHLISGLDEPPDKKLLSDGEIFIKQLAEKQASTETTLEEQLSTNKEFHKGTEFISLIKHTAGPTSLQKFNENSKRTDDWERMKSLDLTDSDIELYFDSRNDNESIEKKHKNLNPEILQKRLERIQSILEKSNLHDTNNETNTAPSRLVMENVLATKPNSVETKLLKFALENTRHDKDALPHPMDNIKDVEAKFMNDLLPVNVKKIRKKCRSLARQIESISTDSIQQEPPKIPPNPCPLVNNSKWDIQLITNPESFDNKSKKVYTCKPKKLYTIRNGEIVEITPQDDKRLTVDDIRKLPKFENYNAGVPSKILFVKNLGNGVTETDLKLIIGDFANQLESIRLMDGGKMRGQAFIEFPNVELAQGCMDYANGRWLKNKPVIIQFGRKKP